MTFKSDKPVEKKDPLKNLQPENSLSSDINAIPGIVESKKETYELLNTQGRLFKAEQKTELWLLEMYGPDAQKAYVNVKERRKFSELIASQLTHEKVSRINNIRNDAIIAADKTILKKDQERNS